ncbi:MAG: CBS domain-containing protein [Myxococcales bacterium]|nr:MAG: CBS domain-containing protein [Myxococcales bacterium]
MTKSPHSIGQDQTLLAAQEKMREFSIRHLPVLKGGKLVGILSDRDIVMVQAMGSLDLEATKVEEAMTPEPFAVSPATPIASVLRHMATHRYGCTVVMSGAKAVGIFTTTDAVRLLAETLDSGSLTGLGELTPGEVRARVLAEHAVIRRLLDKTRLSAENSKNNATKAKLEQMHDDAMELFSVLSKHLNLQEKLLAPALRDADGFGEARASRLMDEISTQRKTLEDCRAIAMAPSIKAAQTVLEFVDNMLDRLKKEESTRLSPELLRDDLIQVSFSG